jgi:class 3 adenylate cyclase
MPKLPIFRLRNSEPAALPELQYHEITLAFRDLQLGVDNLRYDVFLSPRITADLSFHLARYICRFGEVQSLLEMDVPTAAQTQFARAADRAGEDGPKLRKPGPGDMKSLLVSIHLAILNRAKAEANPSVDMLGRLAVLKFIRSELQTQFSKILEQCRLKSKSLEGVRQAKMMQTQELVSSFQVRKKIVIRRAGQEVFHLLREIEKETLARTRRSLLGDLLGDLPADSYRLLLNPLILTEDGRDDYLCAEHYYMFGNFDKDPDRFPRLRQFAVDFLQELGYSSTENAGHLEQALNVPENAATLVGTGNGEDLTPEDRQRQDRLDIWTRMLQRDGALPYIVASYEAVPLLAEYAPRVNPQQIKNALITREEAARVEKIIAECRLHADRLSAAIGRVASCRGSERSRFAARLLHDLFCYHRDLRGLEALNSGFDSINLVTDDKVRQLSTLNGMLYEFLPPEDQKAAEDRVVDHVILKADVRDSSRLTRSLMEKGMNAASYFSLNFYDPINKLLAKYGATKVFLEGDAIIVALLEREGEAMLGVARTCVLAWEIVNLLREYNQLLERSGLPQMEVGLGIAYQDSPPLYLMDGEHRIMISDAINVSDRLSSCNKRVRKKIAPDAGVFQVYSLQIGGSNTADATAKAGAHEAGTHEVEAPEIASEEVRLNYNVGGICLSELAFRKLQQEISLTALQAGSGNKGQRGSGVVGSGSTGPAFYGPGFNGVWLDDQREFFVGTVPIANGAFRKIVIRKNRIAQVDVRDLSILRWTGQYYYEVCANPAIYAALSGEKSASGSH